MEQIAQLIQQGKLLNKLEGNMAKRKNNVNLDDIEKGYNIIKKYWKILRYNSISINNCLNYFNIIRI